MPDPDKTSGWHMHQKTPYKFNTRKGQFLPLSFLFFCKQKSPDILTGKLFRILILIFQKIRDIVFIAVDGTFFKVTDFPASSSCSKYFSYIIKSSI